MKLGEKLWRAFVSVGKVLKDDDLQSFGKALFFGTSFKNLSRGARRTVEAMALKIPSSNAAQIYVAIASQSWGYSDLKQIADAVSDQWLFRQLSERNRNRINRAAAEIDWPAEPTEKPKTLNHFEPRKPDLKTVDPFEERAQESPKRGISAGAGTAIASIAFPLLLGAIL